MKHLVCSLAVAVGVMSATAQGGFMTVTGVQGTGFSNFWNVGDVVSSSSGANTSSGAANSSSTVSLIVSPGIKLTANSKSGGTYGSSNSAIAAGQWLDVIRVSGASAPATLRVTMSVSGRIELIRGIGDVTSQADARVGLFVGSSSSPVGGDSVPEAGQFGLGGAVKVSQVGITKRDAFFGGDKFAQQNTQNLNFDEGTGVMTWDAVFDLTYNASAGGYLMHAYATAYSVSSRSGASSNVDFGHTIKLTGVTNSDGSDVDGDVTFDSGFRLDYLEEVPAPPAVVLAVIGVMSLTGGAAGRRLWKRAGVPQQE